MDVPPQVCVWTRGPQLVVLFGSYETSGLCDLARSGDNYRQVWKISTSGPGLSSLLLHSNDTWRLTAQTPGTTETPRHTLQESSEGISLSSAGITGTNCLPTLVSNTPNDKRKYRLDKIRIKELNKKKKHVNKVKVIVNTLRKIQRAMNLICSSNKERKDQCQHQQSTVEISAGHLWRSEDSWLTDRQQDALLCYNKTSAN